MEFNTFTKGALTLMGKRITGFTTQEFIEGEEYNFDPVQNGVQTVAYVDLDVILRLEERQEVIRCYFEDGEVKDQTIVHGKLDKLAIEAATDDYAVYTVETDEPMEFVITQYTGHASSNTIIRRKPVDGKIQFQLDSKIIGRVTVYGVSDTHYTNEAELLVV